MFDRNLLLLLSLLLERTIIGEGFLQMNNQNRAVVYLGIGLWYPFNFLGVYLLCQLGVLTELWGVECKREYHSVSLNAEDIRLSIAMFRFSFTVFMGDRQLLQYQQFPDFWFTSTVVCSWMQQSFPNSYPFLVTADIEAPTLLQLVGGITQQLFLKDKPRLCFSNYFQDFSIT